MMIETIKAIRGQLIKEAPLIHCITNPISINQCANLVLASGGRPIMAEHPREVQEITHMAKALLLNLGNITDARMESMAISAREAEQWGIPYVYDAVGIACSELRRQFTYDFLTKHSPDVIKGNYSEITSGECFDHIRRMLCQEIICKLTKHSPDVIKGNYSEIQALYNCTYRSSGVDADGSLDAEGTSRIAAELARQYHCVILASGKVDLVTDGQRLVHVENGTPQLASVTGTGCMLGALCGCYVAVCQEPKECRDQAMVKAEAGRKVAADGVLEAVAGACAVLGICGELAETDKGSGTFMVNLMDMLSTLTDREIEKYIKMEEISIENI